MTPVGTLVRRCIDGWNGDLERVLFGTADPTQVAAMINRYCEEHLAGVAGGIFYRSGVGIVVGVTLTDGRRVVLKVHRWNVSLARLAAVQQVQRALAERDLPAPTPLAGPTTLGQGIVTVEEYRPGTGAPARGPRSRATIARALCDFVAAASEVASPLDVGVPALLRARTDPLWPEPHSIRFDFGATASGAEWIDELAETARHGAVTVDAPDAIGHFDWRVENLGFDGSGQVSAIYDWDAVARAPEAVIVGHSAAAYCTDWGHPETSWLPSVADMRGFVTDYEVARGRPFTHAERALVDASNLYVMAYGARCQHSDGVLHPRAGGPPGGRMGGPAAPARQRGAGLSLERPGQREGARVVGLGPPRRSTRSRSAHHVTMARASTTM